MQDVGKETSKLEAPRAVDFACENAGGHLVRLVAHDQVLFRCPELLLQGVVARQLVQAVDHAVDFREHVVLLTDVLRSLVRSSKTELVATVLRGCPARR